MMKDRAKGRDHTSWLSGFMPALLALLFLGSLAAAQPAADPSILRIGMVLPAETEGDELQSAVARGAWQGATFAEEEFEFNAMLMGQELSVLIRTASSPGEATTQAEELIAEGIFGLAGAFDHDSAAALSAVAAQHQLPFLNLGAPSDALRNDECSAFMFHLAPSSAMYLDALAGWYVRAGFRTWYFVTGEDAESQEQYERSNWALKERHFGARDVGRTQVETGMGSADYSAALAAIAKAKPEVVLLLLPAADQLDFLEQFEASDLTMAVTGMPYPAAQTSEFFRQSLERAPRAGSGHRAIAWASVLDAYGARELNARYLARWNEPMQLAGWSAYQAVKIFYEAASFSGSQDGNDLRMYLADQDHVFDIWQGLGASFRPWDHQLRQALYLVELNPLAEGPEQLEVLVGELPAIYMPGTDPVERLDQIGDLQRKSSCSFQAPKTSNNPDISGITTGGKK